MQKFTLCLRNFGVLASLLLVLMAMSFAVPEDSRSFVHDTLNKFYNKDGQRETIKRFEINITKSGFCRFRKVFSNGKEEFFAFSFTRLADVNYYGDELSGDLYLRTKNDDVIVQTRNDKSGAIDSMATYMVIPLKNIDVEQLNILSDHLKKMGANVK